MLREAYVASHQGSEEPFFLGDIVFASYLEDLSEAGEPLVLFEDGGKILAPRPGEDAEGFWTRKAVLTGKGQEVLAGDEDRIELNGIDRWLGGVHLGGENTWRWNGSDQKLEHEAA